MMLTWIDGHLILVLIAAPIVSILVVGFINGRLARRGGAR